MRTLLQQLHAIRRAKRIKAEKQISRRRDDERRAICHAQIHRASMVRSNADVVRYREEFGIRKGGRKW